MVLSTILLIVQVILALGIIGIVLIQRSDSDGLGLGGGGGGFGLISGRAKANLLTRTTAILAGLFMLNSLVLTILNMQESPAALLDRLPDTAVESGTKAGEDGAPVTPLTPATPEATPDTSGSGRVSGAAPAETAPPAETVPVAPQAE